MKKTRKTTNRLEEFESRLRRIVPPEVFEDWRNGTDSESVALRVNTLKTDVEPLVKELSGGGATVQQPAGFPAALVVDKRLVEQRIRKLTGDGRLYRQGLSSQLPVAVLDPRPGERVFDACAAPGSKTTQIAARMKNTGEIVAVDAIRPRFYKLKSVCRLLGADNVTFVFKDARRFRCGQELFDAVLVDAPCSSEGRIRPDDPASYRTWSPRKIKEMVRKQRGLLLNACRLVRTGGRVVYSTCTFAPEENEGVVDWLLRKTDGAFQVEPLSLPGVPRSSTLAEWEGKVYAPEIRHCFRVRPGPLFEGFFVAKLSRLR